MKTIENRVTFKQKLAGLALAAAAALSTLPGCTGTSKSPTATPSPTATYTPTPTPTSTPLPACTPQMCGNATPTSYVCPVMNVGGQTTFNGHLLELYSVTNGSIAAGVKVDGTLVYICLGMCDTINGVNIKMCGIDEQQNSAYFCASQ